MTAEMICLEPCQCRGAMEQSCRETDLGKLLAAHNLCEAIQGLTEQLGSMIGLSQVDGDRVCEVRVDLL